MTRPSRTPRRPSIGFCSCNLRTAPSSFLSFSVALSPSRAILIDSSVRSGKELVQRRVDHPDRHRQAVHGVQDLDEVAALQRLQSIERVLALLLGVGQDQVLDQLTALAKEHVLRADQAHAFGAEPACQSGPVSALAATPSRRLASEQ